MLVFDLFQDLFNVHFSAVNYNYVVRGKFKNNFLTVPPTSGFTVGTIPALIADVPSLSDYLNLIILCLV